MADRHKVPLHLEVHAYLREARLTIPLEGKRSKKGNVTYRDKKVHVPRYSGTAVQLYSCTATAAVQLQLQLYSSTAVLRY